MNKPTQEYGYILIDTPEKKAQFAPKRKGDQHFASCGSWEDCCCATDRLHRDEIYRRPISPGEGWELVPENEVGSTECEWTTDGIEWTQAHSFTAGETIKQAMEKKGGYGDFLGRPIIAFRRRPKSPQTGWVKCSERLPEDCVTVLCWDGLGSLTGDSGRTWTAYYAHDTGWEDDRTPAYWSPLPIRPEPTPAQNAWDALTDKPTNAKAAFIAGFEKGGAK